MSYGWQLSDEAKEAIDQQMIWCESTESHGGAELADRWLAKLEPAFEKLAAAPHRHSLAPENGLWYAELEVRQLLFRPWKTGAGWRVLYTIDEAKKCVTVLQVRHERRRWLFEIEGDGG